MTIPRIQMGKGGPKKLCDLRTVTKDWFSLPQNWTRRLCESSASFAKLSETQFLQIRYNSKHLFAKDVRMKIRITIAYLYALHNEYDPRTSAIIFVSLF